MQQAINVKEIETAMNQFGDVVVTKNEKNDVVVMSLEDYNKEMMKKDIVKHLLKSEDDIENGRVRDAREVFKEWKEKYGI